LGIKDETTMEVIEEEIREEIKVGIKQ